MSTPLKKSTRPRKGKQNTSQVDSKEYQSAISQSGLELEGARNRSDNIDGISPNSADDQPISGEGAASGEPKSQEIETDVPETQPNLGGESNTPAWEAKLDSVLKALIRE